jgi:hypothetical protein
MKFTRRDLIVQTAGAAIFTIPSLATAQTQDAPPPLPTELVRKFVIAAHVKLEDVKTLLEETPALLNTTIDWRNGDFESAIGGASHMGHRDIAEYLIAQGARTDLFTHTMLGHLDIVKPILTRFPSMINCKGPHGISLIRHAEKGGEHANEVLDFLKTIAKLHA